MNGTNKPTNDPSPNVPTNVGSLGQASHYYAQTQPQAVDIYSPNSNQSQMPPPMHNPTFTNSQSPISPQFSSGGQQPSPMQTMNQASMRYNQPLFDPSDPALFNFDISSLNFGNQYGAAEFGMLHHMSTSAYDANGQPGMMNNMGQMQDSFNPQYGDNQGLLFGQDALINDWHRNQARSNSSTTTILATPGGTPVVSNLDRQDSMNGMPHGYAIGAGPGSLASASPASQTDHPGMSDSPAPALFLNTNQHTQSSPTFTKPLLPQQQQQQQSSQQQPPPPQHPQPQQQPVQPHVAGTDAGNQLSYSHVLNGSRKRPHDADYIYESTTQAYSYTTGFHRLLHYIVHRFGSAKRVRIAKALAAIRPSLITFSQRLTGRDLVFMEVSVQRKLFEYVEFINAYGTPTLITRRDGVVIAASKEFMILTGWRREVLLGKEPNLNVNLGGGSGATTAPGSGNVSAVRTREGSPKGAGGSADDTIKDGKDGLLTKSPHENQPVLIAELMDQDSVVEFYEDYAKLAFNDPAGHACRRGKLLKYRSKEDVLNATQQQQQQQQPQPQQQRAGGEHEDHPHKEREARDRERKDGGIAGEAGINRLGEKEGMVDCMYIWNVRRDIFEVPMLIVMNVSP